MALFGGTKSQGRMFRAGEATASFDDIPAILLQVQCTVQRNLQPIPTLTEGIVWSAQPVQGQMTANTILASDKKITDIANEPCKKISGNIEFNGVECKDGTVADGGGATLTIDDGYCNSISISASGQNGYIGSDVQIMFTNATLS